MNLSLWETKKREIVPGYLAKVLVGFHIFCLLKLLCQEGEINAETSSQIHHSLPVYREKTFHQLLLVESCLLATALFQREFWREENALDFEPRWKFPLGYLQTCYLLQAEVKVDASRNLA